MNKDLEDKIRELK